MLAYSQRLDWGVHMGEIVSFPARGTHPNAGLVEELLDRIILPSGGKLRSIDRERIHDALEPLWQIGTARRDHLRVRRIVRALDWAGDQWLMKVAEIFSQDAPGAFEHLRRGLWDRIPEDHLPATLLCAIVILQPQDVQRTVVMLEIMAG